MTNFGELPAWARPAAPPETASQKRKDRKAAKQAEKAQKAERAASTGATSATSSTGTSSTGTAVSSEPNPAAAPSRRGRQAAGDGASLGELPSWASGKPSGGTADSGSRRQRQAAVEEPVVEEAPVVQLVLDPDAPVHEEFGRLITSQQFSTKRIEIFEHAAVRIAGPLAPNPAFETLMSISFTRPEEKSRGRFGKIIEKTTAKSYQLLDEQQPMPEACLTIVTDVRTHEIHEAPPSPEGITAGLLLVAAGDLATASPADQAKVFADLLGIAAVGAPIDDVQLPDITGDFERDQVIKMAKGWAPPPPTFAWDTPSTEATAVDAAAAPVAPPPASAPAMPTFDPTPPLGMMEPLVAEITRAVEEAASTLSAPLQPIAVPPAGVSIGRTAERSPADRLRDLAQLHRDGLLSDAEFERKRQALIDEL
ncbi:MAG: SHOCT domain-containing protein [Ilumatobacteraceae bacterium]